MEPPAGLPPDKDKQLILPAKQPSVEQQQQQQKESQQQQIPFQQNEPQQQQQQLLPTIAKTSSPADSSRKFSTIASFPAATSNFVTSSASPALATAATALSATAQAATAFSGTSIGYPHAHQHHQQHGHQHHYYHGTLQQNLSTSTSLLLGGITSGGSSGSAGQQQPIEKLSRPMAFDKMESLVREMQDPEHGVPVRQQKMFLTSIPYAFMGYDLIEWLMDRLLIEESEALNIANQLCLHGYFFPVNDTKTLTVKDDSSLYRFQTPYYWPWQHKAPDNVEYAIYLAKRSLRNKQRHALEDYEAEALASLHKNLKGKWDFISMQAEEQVRLAKERKKGDKIVGDSQERAFWRVHRPPPGQFTPLEPCPIPSRDRQGSKQNKKKSIDDMQRDVDYLKKSLNRTRMKMSQACESLVGYSETFAEYDFFLQPVLPSNPWVTEDITFWQLNNTFVDIPTEKRVKRWAISIEELVSDPTGLQEFTTFLEKEYSHENIRFWIAVNRLRRSAHSQVAHKVKEIYDEFLKPGAPCEINIDSKTMESVIKGLKSPSRFTFDAASEHIYMLLLKKDCYPRFVRSDHYKRLLETGIQPSHKKRFFNFGGVSGAKKKMTAALSSQPNLGESSSSKCATNVGVSIMQAPPPGSLARRRGSDRSLTGSAHELAVIGTNKDAASKVPHSHSQSNLSDIPYREPPKQRVTRLETTAESLNSTICPWDTPSEPTISCESTAAQVKLAICPWEHDGEFTTTEKFGAQRLTSTSSDISDVADRVQRNLGIRHQNTVDSGETGVKRLIPALCEQRRASVSFTPSRAFEHQIERPSLSKKISSTPSPTVESQTTIIETTPIAEHKVLQIAAPTILATITTISAAAATATATTTTTTTTTTVAAAVTTTLITKNISQTASIESEEEMRKLTESNIDCANSEQRSISPSIVTPTITPPLVTKITPTPPPLPPPDDRIITDDYQIPESPKSLRLSHEEEVEKLKKIEKIDKIEKTENSGNTIDLGIELQGQVKEVQIELIESNEENIEDNSESNMSSMQREMPMNIAESVVELTIQTLSIGPNLEITNSEIINQMLPTKKAANLVPKEHESEFDKLSENKSQQTLERKPLNAGERQQLLESENYEIQEELSPTTDEYREGLQFGSDDRDVCDYELSNRSKHTGYIAPASTPAPSLAPLAEMDVDTVDDETCEEIKQIQASAYETEAAATNAATDTKTIIVDKATTSVMPQQTSANTEDGKKRRKKRNSEGKKVASFEEKERPSTSTEANRNAVCPWEDEFGNKNLVAI